MVKFDNNQSFDELVKNNKFIIFDFSQENCSRCKILEDNFKTLDQNILVYYVDVRNNMKLVRKLNIYASPCAMIYFDGNLVYRNLGTFDFKEINDVINKYNN